MAQLVEAASPAVVGPGFGATFHGFWNYDSETQMTTALRSLKQAGGTWVRIDLGWAAVETSKDFYSDWALRKYDTAVNRAHDEGLNVLLVLQRTPKWANGSDDHTLAPHSTSEFGDFARDMSLRYAGKVQTIEVWNEPNLRSFFTARVPGKEAEEHTAMVKDAYTKIKTQGPQGSNSVTVLAGGPSHVDTDWWRRMYQQGIKNYTDVVAVNPYMSASNLSPLVADQGTKYRMNHTAALIRLMTEYGDGNKPVWFTEFGWSTHANTSSTPPWELGVSEAVQADYLEETFNLLRSEYPTVEQVFWYNLRTKATGSLHQDGYGLLQRDLTRKPVMERLALILGGS